MKRARYSSFVARVQVWWSVCEGAVVFLPSGTSVGRGSRTSPMDDCRGCLTNHAYLGVQPQETLAM